MYNTHKILVVSEVFYPENGLINDFVLELQKKGHTVDILTQHPSYPESKIYEGYDNKYFTEDSFNGSKIFRFKLVEGYKNSLLKKILNYFTFVVVGKKIGKKIGKEYDHILVYQTGPLTVSLPALAIKKSYKKKVTIWTFDIWPDAVYAYGFPKVFPLDFMLKNFIKKVYNRCDNVLVSSKRFTQTIHEYAPEKDIIYAPNWMIAEEQVKSSLLLDREKFNFTFTGNISKSQNLKNVVLGWKKANVSDKAILNIVGTGSYYEELKTLIKEESIKGIILHGKFPSNQILDILGQSDTLILPLISSHGIDKTEPFKIQSYLSAKKPILGILNGSGRDIILEHSLGLSADPQDLDDIALKFEESICFAKNTMNDVSSRSTKVLNERFNRDRIIEKVLSIITK